MSRLRLEWIAIYLNDQVVDERSIPLAKKRKSPVTAGASRTLYPSEMQRRFACPRFGIP